jgi:hypothetical protein
MRTPRKTLLAIAAVAALAVAGCGGSEVEADEVPDDPPALTSPSDSELGTGSDTGTGTEDDTTIEPEATEDPADTGEVVPAVPEEDPAAAVVPEEPTAVPEDTTTEPAAPEEAPPDQLDSFCEQNVGAC